MSNILWLQNKFHSLHHLWVNKCYDSTVRWVNTCSSVHKHKSIILPSRTHTHTLSPLAASLAHLLWSVFVLLCCDLWQREQRQPAWINPTMNESYWRQPTLTLSTLDSHISSKTQTSTQALKSTVGSLSHIQAILSLSCCQCCMFASSLCDSWSWGSVLCDWTTGKWSV